MTCKSSALCLFDEQEIQMDISGSGITDFHPLNSITPNSPIEFKIPGTVENYIDLGDLQLLVQLRIRKTDGKAWNADDQVCFVNLPISSIFQDVFLKIGDTQVEGGQHLYPYNGYLSTLLQFHPSAKQTHLQSWGWNEDTPGKFDDAATNEGITFREAETSKGKTWEIMGPLFLDMARQPRYLLPQTNLYLKLLPAKAEFALHATKAAKGYEYRIQKCVLYARHINVMDAVINGHNKGLEKHNAKYFLNHIDISNFTITKDVQSFMKDGLFATQVPKMVVIGLLDHDAFNGDISQSPFNFQNFGLSKIALYRNGELVPGQIFTPDYDKDHFLRAYNHTMTTLNYFNTDDSNGITMEHFKDGYNLYAFDLTPDGTNEGPHRHLIRTGSLRLELAFTKAVAKPITVLMFSIIDAKLEITKLRDVLMTYSR